MSLCFSLLLVHSQLYFIVQSFKEKLKKQRMNENAYRSSLFEKGMNVASRLRKIFHICEVFMLLFSLTLTFTKK